MTENRQDNLFKALLVHGSKRRYFKLIFINPPYKNFDVLENGTYSSITKAIEITLANYEAMGRKIHEKAEFEINDATKQILFAENSTFTNRYKDISIKIKD